MAALVEAMRAQTKASERLIEKMEKVDGAVSEMKRDIAVMQVHNEQAAQDAATVAALAARVTALELRASEQNGAAKFATMLKDFGPWLVSLLIGLYALINTGGSAK